MTTWLVPQDQHPWPLILPLLKPGELEKHGWVIKARRNDEYAHEPYGPNHPYYPLKDIIYYQLGNPDRHTSISVDVYDPRPYLPREYDLKAELKSLRLQEAAYKRRPTLKSALEPQMPLHEIDAILDGYRETWRLQSGSLEKRDWYDDIRKLVSLALMKQDKKLLEQADNELRSFRSGHRGIATYSMTGGPNSRQVQVYQAFRELHRHVRKMYWGEVPDVHAPTITQDEYSPEGSLAPVFVRRRETPKENDNA